MTDIIMRLYHVLAGKCSCTSKSAVLGQHDENCISRIMTDALLEISALRAARALTPNPSKEQINTLVDRFLTWPLPETVCADPCATEYGREGRTGTNLLSAGEAREMILYLLGIGPQEYMCPLEIRQLFKNEQDKPRGRELAIEWARTLVLRPGDRVYLPEVGWLTKAEPNQGNKP